MRSWNLPVRSAWKVLGRTRRSQAAWMAIAPGESEGGPDNHHPRSDQWLFVMRGAGTATIGKRTIRLKRGTLLLIKAGENHTIRAGERTRLETLNFYAVPMNFSN